MLAEIRRATEETRDIPVESIDREHFPLDECRPLLAEVASELDSGLGFAVIAGFPAQEYDRDVAVRAFLGVSSYLDDAVDQT